MDPVWEELHASRPWGKYPAEHLLRAVLRTYRDPEERRRTRALELGCGAGANLSFLLAEGFQTHGIDGAPSAIANAEARLRPLVAPGQVLDLKVQIFEEMAFPPESVDLVIDYFALYANRLAVIEAAHKAVHAMLTPGGRVYARMWGTATTGATTGRMLEPGTSENPEAGPCKDMGVSHFIDRAGIERLFAPYGDVRIDRVLTEEQGGDVIEEWAVWAQK